MILKEADNKDNLLTELAKLESIADSFQKKKISEEIRILRAGIQGERESAYLIDFDLKNSDNTIVIHDLRLEYDGRVAQIDHIIIHRLMLFVVLETKHFSSGIKISSSGEFLRWNDWKRTYEGMASPILQNERHISVLKDVMTKYKMPSGFFFDLKPTYRNRVLVSSTARIDRPKDFKESDQVIKADFFTKEYQKIIDDFPSISRASKEDLLKIGNYLLSLHKPITFDYAAKFGISKPEASITAPQPKVAHLENSAINNLSANTSVDHGQVKTRYVCKKCSSSKLSVVHGRFGYYFKCADCSGNTPINMKFSPFGENSKIRKSDNKFFFDSADLKSSELFFEND